MPKNSVSEWSTTAASNTDVGGVDLGENTMRPRDVNNAIRTMMAQIAETSDSGTWTPTLTFATPGDLAVTYTTQSGWWRRFGDLVILSMRINTSAFTHSTASGALRIGGSPFTSVSVSGQEFGAMRYQGITKAGFSDFGMINILSASYLESRAAGSGLSAVTIDAADMPSGGSVILNCVISMLVS